MDLKIEYLNDKIEVIKDISQDDLIKWLKENMHYPVKHFDPPGPEDGTLLRNRPYRQFVPKEGKWVRVTLVEETKNAKDL